MARGINKAICVGNLGRAPDLRYTQGGTAVCTFSLATAERLKSGGEWIDHTEWHNIVVFGKAAENVSNHLKKGSPVYIEGRIQTRKWQDREGKERTTTEIIANVIQFLGDSRNGGASKPTGQDNAGDGFPDDVGFDPSFSDDTPF